MGKKYEAYEAATKAEQETFDRYRSDPTDQNLREVQNTRQIADVTWGELLDDPTG